MTWKEKVHEVIYEADTKAGKVFDVALFIIIVASLVLVILDSVEHISLEYHTLFVTLEWIITIFFTIEYILRVISIKKPKNYIFSFYGIVDFLSTIPLYVSLIFASSGALLSLRALRLLRVFRVFKLVRYTGAGSSVAVALRKSIPKILIFLYSVVIISFIAGTVMYIVEGPENGYTSIPTGIYWAIVTLTTVGFGDIHPVTPLGQFIATIIMLLGYGVIAVPTGIVTAEMTKENTRKNTQVCSNCGEADHRDSAEFCHNCGDSLHKEQEKEIKNED
ncbi:potassium voltage-gated channel, putative [Psychroflexus gondwanensis ACAM 44]|jgi:voltage-gated potassium channel|uniref:Potassium voltage-gated channel, putative n=1 Tax=Psychroflexus gondwanensis ACAM 44 TaxID=1189619 RepID=N1WXA6_9FLAO|nr:ion transporter [Psychroflexus gondwanensis]EMY81837.1 potassium voltage-gated channel, putative [Psychroflexus gondwanensis ACAM 44]